MAQAIQAQAETPAVQSRATFFGAPIGEFGWFASLLIGATLGFCAFFLTTFLGIVGISIYNSVAKANVSLAYSYMPGGVVVGSLVMLSAWAYLGKLWVARIKG
jgi:hypothetical protein